MSVYYDALELNTAMKPFAFRRFPSGGRRQPTSSDLDIYVFRPLDAVRQAWRKRNLR